jgi:protease-4
MKINTLVNAIARREWFISPAFLDANAFLLNQLLNGNLEVTAEQLPPAHIIYNVSGNKFSQSEISAADSSLMVDFAAISSPNTIIKIPVIGAMFKYEGLCTWGMENVKDALVEAAQHKNCSCVILDIDSGGGEVAAVAPVIEGIKAMNKAGKPVVALCDVACSAAQWIAAACNHIVASNDISSTFGSIGVMVSFVDVQPFMEKQGYVFHTIYAPESSEKNLAFELALKGEYDKIKNDILSPLAKKFIAEIKALRPVKVSDDHVVFRCYIQCSNALEIGLIDKIDPQILHRLHFFIPSCH